MSKTKIILYNPQAVFYTMPLSLMAIASMLDPEQFDVRITDGRLHADPIAEVLSQLDGALVLGMTVLTGAPIRDALAVARAAKAQFPDLTIVWGGWHSSLFPTDTLEESSVDITVQGQGELTFVELIKRLQDGSSLHGLTGISFRSAENVPTQNLPRALTPMEQLPSANYGLIDVESYFKLKGERQLDYISSTGCYFRCTFCADPFVYNRKWVAISPERMGDEIEHLWRKYQFTDLNLQDETFFTKRDRVMEIAEQFIRRDLHFSWAATMRADQGVRLSDDAFGLCVKSGLRRVMIGVESGSQEMLDWMKKDVTIEQIIASAEMCVRHDIAAIFPFIVGFPNETDKSVAASLAMVKQLRRMSPRFETPIFYFKPYPGSAITDEVVKQGYQLPNTVEGWANFDYIGSSGPWVTPERYQMVERFKFYNRFAWGPERLIRRPMQWLARIRCSRDFYDFPIEKIVLDRLKPLPTLS